MGISKKTRPKKTGASVAPKVSYYRKPEGMTLEQWQIALRQQFAETQHFVVHNIGDSEVFSEYSVSNHKTDSTYKVAIRSKEPGKNFCSCLDFKTNLLGTCKHIEFVLLQINKTAKKRKILEKDYWPHYTSVYLDYGSERKVKIRIGTEKNEEFARLARAYFDKDNTLEPIAYEAVDVFFQKAYRLHSEFRCYPDALAHIIEQRERKQRNKIIDRSLEKSDEFFKSVIHADLFPYQREGVEFAMRKGRCLIADDMGLGKTIQAIAAAEGMKKLFGISKVLIICPTSLKYQWKTEIERFTKSEVCVVEGNVLEREKQYADGTYYKICSYNVVGRDITSINQNDFDLVILDEAQRIKNWKTQTAESVKKVKSKYCIVLTGTPLENKLEELYSVVQMVNPLLLGALFRFVAAHQITAPDTDKVIGYKDLDKIAELLQDILLRRHKSKVLKQLPERMDKNLFVPMTAKQMDYYNDAYDNVVRLINKWSRFKFLSEKDRQSLLINLNLMRMACNSTFIIDQQTRHDTKIEELMNILEEALDDESEKVVIFSQWERMTRIVGQELTKKGIGYESLHGGVPSKHREVLFDNFRNNPKTRVFLSTDAGGVGLNLQSASLLINLDLPWNPAVLEQRIARIHRMGQKKNVQVINLISKNTIEEEMLTKLKFKSSVAAGILDNGESSVFLGESKFNKLMREVQDLTENSSRPELAEREEAEEAPAYQTVKTGKPQTEQEAGSIAEQQMSLFENEGKEAVSEKNPAQDLLESGTDFIGKLLHTLSDKKKTDNLIETLVKKDEKSGKTYLQIPVENEQIVENGLKMISQLLSGFSK